MSSPEVISAIPVSSEDDCNETAGNDASGNLAGGNLAAPSTYRSWESAGADAHSFQILHSVTQRLKNARRQRQIRLLRFRGPPLSLGSFAVVANVP